MSSSFSNESFVIVPWIGGTLIKKTAIRQPIPPGLDILSKFFSMSVHLFFIIRNQFIRNETVQIKIFRQNKNLISLFYDFLRNLFSIFCAVLPIFGHSYHVLSNYLRNKKLLKDFLNSKIAYTKKLFQCPSNPKFLITNKCIIIKWFWNTWQHWHDTSQISPSEVIGLRMIWEISRWFCYLWLMISSIVMMYSSINYSIFHLI